MAGEEVAAAEKPSMGHTVDAAENQELAVTDEPPAADSAAAPPPPSEDEGDDSDSEINWVEMPEEHLHWILAKKRETDPVPTLEEFGIYTEEDLEKKDADKLIRRTIASLQASQDDWFEYQAWVRDVFERNGCVMVPEGVFGPKDELQKAIDSAWFDAVHANANFNTGEAHLNGGDVESDS